MSQGPFTEEEQYENYYERYLPARSAYNRARSEAEVDSRVPGAHSLESALPQLEEWLHGVASMNDETRAEMEQWLSQFPPHKVPGQEWPGWGDYIARLNR